MNVLFFRSVTLLRRGEARVMNLSNYHFETRFRIQVPSTKNGQKNGSAEDSAGL